MTPNRQGAPQSVHDEVQTAIQQLISVHGFYSPVELLLTANQLGYDDYQAWRRGEHETLDELLADGVPAAQSLLEEAAIWARGLHLGAEPVPLLGTQSHAGIDLRASANARLDNLLHTEYRRDVDRAQPDLFLDGADADRQNELIEAITAHDVATADERLRQFEAVDPGHWVIPHATALIEALHALPVERMDEARERLDQLERSWLPAASALLRSDARDFLSPIWRDLGQAFEGVPFRREEPKVHASWAYLNGLDWGNLKRAVMRTLNLASEPVLQIRLAHAQWRLSERREAIRIWFALCWRAPDHFAECIESPTFPSSTLQRAWTEAQEQAMDPPITPPWFPAWAVIGHAGYARDVGPCGGTSDPERTFDHLVALRRGHSDREDLDHRRALQELHGDLLSRYLASIGD